MEIILQVKTNKESEVRDQLAIAVKEIERGIARTSIKIKPKAKAKVKAK